ncbi:hypothetical protein BDV95DRAFT_587103 [Massariosphaeria phaeospora]|uniref:Uncharacterized protein n=1 Tax=Massariosphaeria phaeospora TaxID=100035 RepID=A0A7C8HYN8_9PLEO|nr:hypothetical protein BDV95DRAFT_587103 [Massariosphaeria phaeospora]
MAAWSSQIFVAVLNLCVGYTLGILNDAIVGRPYTCVWFWSRVSLAFLVSLFLYAVSRQGVDDMV